MTIWSVGRSVCRIWPDARDVKSGSLQILKRSLVLLLLLLTFSKVRKRGQGSDLDSGQRRGRVKYGGDLQTWRRTDEARDPHDPALLRRRV